MNFFRSVDKANMEVHVADTEIVINLQVVSVVLNIFIIFLWMSLYCQFRDMD